MPSTFRPEASPLFVAADGVTDCLPAFDDVIARMADGDILQLGAAGAYALSAPLEIAKSIVIQGELAPHFVLSPSEIFTNVIGEAGLRLFGKCTLMNLQLNGRLGPNTPQYSWPIVSSVVAANECTVTLDLGDPPVPHNIAVDSFVTTSGLERTAPPTISGNTGRARVTGTTATTITFPLFIRDGNYGPGYITSANHGIWSRRTLRLVNVGVHGYRGDGVFLDTNTLHAATASVVVDAAGIATVTTTRPHPFRPGMYVESTGWAPRNLSETLILAVPAPDQLTVLMGGPNNVTATGGMISTTEDTGNADHWHVDTLRVNANLGHGFHTLGPRANAGVAIKLDATSNGGVAVWEEGFLGNSYLACHTSLNRLGSYVKPSSSDSNRTIFLGCYAETNQPDPICMAPASRYAGAGHWTGGGLANGWPVGYNVPSAFPNENANNDLRIDVTSSRIAGGELICTVSAFDPRDLRAGMRATTTGLVSDVTTPTTFTRTTATEIVFATTLPDVPPQNGGMVTFQNTLTFEIGGRTDTIYTYRSSMEASGAGSAWYGKVYSHDVDDTRDQWFVTRYGSQPANIVEAESGRYSRDDRNGPLIGVAQKWFPNGMYLGPRGDMAKLESHRRIHGAVTYRCLFYRESGAAQALRAIAWGPTFPVGGPATAPPADIWTAGDVVWNSAPGVSGPLGWVCTASGTAAAPAGTWEEMPRLSPTAAGRSVQEVLRVPFTAASPADLFIYNADCPAATSILDVQVIVTTASATGTAQLLNGTVAPAALSDAFQTTAAGRFRTSGLTVTSVPTVPAGGSLVLRRTNTAAVGEMVIWVQRS